MQPSNSIQETCNINVENNMQGNLVKRIYSETYKTRGKTVEAFLL